jgi:hypothetical protein
VIGGVCSALLALHVVGAQPPARAGGDSVRTSTPRDSARASTAAPRDSTQTAATADSTRRRGVSVLPALGYAPETGVVVGAAVFTLRRNPRDSSVRPSSFNAVATRSVRAQSVVRVASEVWAHQNRGRAFGFAQYARVPFTFFGIGRGSGAVEEDFTPETVTLYAEAQRRFGRGWYVGGGTEFARLTLPRVEAGGALAADTILGSRGSRVLSMLALVSYDTREDVFQPRRGQFVQFTLLGAPRALGSEFGHGRITVDARGYRAVTRRAVVAWQAFADHVDGDVPFDRLATIGGSAIARGYLAGRFRDREAVALQGEWRQAIRGRLGVVLFGGAAQVGAGTGDVFRATPLPFGGGGVRWRLQPNERLAVRIDYGFTRDSRGFYLAVGEAF